MNVDLTKEGQYKMQSPKCTMTNAECGNPLARAAVYSAFVILHLALCRPALAADPPGGLGLDADLEKRLGAALTELNGMVRADAPDFARLAAGIREARRPAAALADLAARTRSQPGAAVPQQPDAVTLPSPVPVVLLGRDGAAAPTVEQVRKLWAGQLKVALGAARGILAGQIPLINEWVSWPNMDRRTGRAATIGEALREAEKAALLLAAKPDPLAVKLGEQLFADDFSRGIENWLPFGPHKATLQDGALRFVDTTPQHPDAMMWTKQEFSGNFLVEFTFIPYSSGARPGALFTICGRPRPGKELDVCVGDSMNTYNFGIDGYHFSMHRGNTGLGNGRRVGTGLKMLASGPDPCPTVGRSYRVAVGKWDNVLMLTVDGKLVHHYLDAGAYGPVLAEGRIGLRHWAGCDAGYKDLRVYRLTSAKEGAMLIEPKGRVLYEEAFRDVKNWRHEGGGTMALDAAEPNTLRIECVGSAQGKAGSQAFCLADFPDGVAVEYDLKVLTKNGLVITFVAMKGSRGEDMFDAAQPKREGVFGDYVRNGRLVSYHVSVSRYDDGGVHTGVSNWRRNPGLNLMREGPDLCREIGRWYRIRIVKDGGHCQLGVNGALAHEFTDPKELPGPLPAGGKVGFRAIGSEVRALVRNFKVTALRPAP